MAKKKENPAEMPVEERLKTLFQLQTILTEIDRIRTLRGELPLEVEDLEDTIEGLKTRISKTETEITDLRAKINEHKGKIELANSQLATYKEQMDNVRNNREYDLLNKEIEFQTLEIELCNKRIREAQALEKGREEALVKSKEELDGRMQDLEVKKNELDEIVAETRLTRRNSAKRPRILKRSSNHDCCRVSSASARTAETVLALFMCSVMPAEVASLRFRHSVNSTFVCAKKSSFVNIADAFLLIRNWQALSPMHQPRKSQSAALAVRRKRTNK